MPQPTSVLFSAADQAVLLRELNGDPWNAVLQVQTRSSLDEGRLRAAVEAACQRHPMARARCDEDPSKAAAPVWTIPDELDVDPLVVRECPDDESLRRLREELVMLRLSLRSSPPLRVFLVRRPGGDVVISVTSHVPMDGLSGVRFHLSVALAYRGAEDPPDPVDFAETRGLATTSPSAAGPAPRVHHARLRWGAELVARAMRPAVRVAKVGTPGEGPYGFVHHGLDAARIAALLETRPPGSSLNDVLVAALHLTIDGWNKDHGAPRGRIAVSVPVSTRPPEWGASMVGNFISTRSTVTAPADRGDLGTATRVVAAELAEWREQVRSGQTIVSVPAGGGLPLAVKKVLQGPTARATGGRAQPSATLVTFGRLPEGLRFDDQPPPEVSLYPLCPPPVGVGLSTLSVGDDVFAALRYHRTQFSPDAAARFADRFLEVLSG